MALDDIDENGNSGDDEFIGENTLPEMPAPPEESTKEMDVSEEPEPFEEIKIPGEEDIPLDTAPVPEDAPDADSLDIEGNNSKETLPLEADGNVLRPTEELIEMNEFIEEEEPVTASIEAILDDILPDDKTEGVPLAKFDKKIEEANVQTSEKADTADLSGLSDDRVLRNKVDSWFEKHAKTRLGYKEVASNYISKAKVDAVNTLQTSEKVLDYDKDSDSFAEERLEQFVQKNYDTIFFQEEIIEKEKIASTLRNKGDFEEKINLVLDEIEKGLVEGKRNYFGRKNEEGIFFNRDAVKAKRDELSHLIPINKLDSDLGKRFGDYILSVDLIKLVDELKEEPEKYKVYEDGRRVEYTDINKLKINPVFAGYEKRVKTAKQMEKDQEDIGREFRKHQEGWRLPSIDINTERGKGIIAKEIAIATFADINIIPTPDMVSELRNLALYNVDEFYNAGQKFEITSELRKFAKDIYNKHIPEHIEKKGEEDSVRNLEKKIREEFVEGGYAGIIGNDDVMPIRDGFLKTNPKKRPDGSWDADELAIYINKDYLKQKKQANGGGIMPDQPTQPVPKREQYDPARQSKVERIKSHMKPPPREINLKSAVPYIALAASTIAVILALLFGGRKTIEYKGQQTSKKELEQIARTSADDVARRLLSPYNKTAVQEVTDAKQDKQMTAIETAVAKAEEGLKAVRGDIGNLIDSTATQTSELKETAETRYKETTTYRENLDKRLTGMEKAQKDTSSGVENLNTLFTGFKGDYNKFNKDVYEKLLSLTTGYEGLKKELKDIVASALNEYDEQKKVPEKSEGVGPEPENGKEKPELENGEGIGPNPEDNGEKPEFVPKPDIEKKKVEVEIEKPYEFVAKKGFWPRGFTLKIDYFNVEANDTKEVAGKYSGKFRWGGRFFNLTAGIDAHAGYWSGKLEGNNNLTDYTLGLGVTGKGGNSEFAVDVNYLRHTRDTDFRDTARNLETNTYGDLSGWSATVDFKVPISNLNWVFEGHYKTASGKLDKKTHMLGLTTKETVDADVTNWEVKPGIRLTDFGEKRAGLYFRVIAGESGVEKGDIEYASNWSGVGLKIEAPIYKQLTFFGELDVVHYRRKAKGISEKANNGVEARGAAGIQLKLW